MANEFNPFHIRHVEITEYRIDGVRSVVLSEKSNGFLAMRSY
jgi:hypothetical protein